MGVMIELSDGQTFVPELPSWMSNGNEAFEPTDLSEEPSAGTIELLSATTAPRIVHPQDAPWVDSQLDFFPSDSVDVPGSPVQPIDANPRVSQPTSGGCSTLSTPLSAGVTFGLILLGLVSLRRRARSER